MVAPSSGRRNFPSTSLLLVACRKSKMASGAIKKTTGLTGLAVAKNPHHSLTVLYNKILAALRKMPETSVYRQSTQALIEDRFRHVKAEKDVCALEEKIGCGQVEELIVQAENELSLARRMTRYQPWHPLAAPPPKDQWTWPA